MNKNEIYTYHPGTSYLYHFGIRGQRWGVRNYQNPDGSLTSAGRERYGSSSASTGRSAGGSTAGAGSVAGRRVGIIRSAGESTAGAGSVAGRRVGIIRRAAATVTSSVSAASQNRTERKIAKEDERRKKEEEAKKKTEEPKQSTKQQTGSTEEAKPQNNVGEKTGALDKGKKTELSLHDKSEQAETKQGGATESKKSESSENKQGGSSESKTSSKRTMVPNSKVDLSDDELKARNIRLAQEKKYLDATNETRKAREAKAQNLHSTQSIVNSTQSLSNSTANFVRTLPKNTKIIKAKQVDLSAYTNQELQEMITRANIERQWNQTFNPDKVVTNKGRERTLQMLETGAAALGVIGSAVGVAATIADMRAKRA